MPLLWQKICLCVEHIQLPKFSGNSFTFRFSSWFQWYEILTTFSRFLLNRLAATGQVESMNKLNQLMSTETRKEVSFDNRLCNAYLVAGRGREYLEAMVRGLKVLASVQDLSIAAFVSGAWAWRAESTELRTRTWATERQISPGWSYGYFGNRSRSRG